MASTEEASDLNKCLQLDKMIRLFTAASRGQFSKGEEWLAFKEWFNQLIELYFCGIKNL